MHPPIRDQADIGTVNVELDASDGALIENGDTVTENKDVARQEFKNDADLHYMLSRFGVIPPRGAPQYGEWDDSLDLQQAIESVREAKEGYENLPPDLKAKFGSMEDLLAAVTNGSLVLKHEEAPPEPKPQPHPLQAELDQLKQEVNFLRSNNRS